MAILGISKVWVTVGPIVVINAVLFVSLMAFTFTKHTKRRDVPEAATRTASKFLSVHLKEWWVWTTDPLAKTFVRLRMGPNFISMIGFLLAAVAGILFARGLFGYAGWAMIFGATFDIFDGRVARLSGRETRSGAYFDSVLDRFSEGVCFVGLAYFFRASWMLPFVVAGIIGSMAVSYTKARAESMGVECKVGSMQRPERIVYLGVASIFTPVATIILSRWWSDPLPILVIGALLIIAVMTNATAVYRMLYTMNSMDTADKRDKESIPQLITRLATPEGRNAFWDKARYGYDRTRSHYSLIVQFMLDGMDRRVFGEMMGRGELPNIAQHVVERGGSVETVSTFPATTGPALTPFVTGCFPGTCGIPGARWFDRTIPEGRILTMNRFRDYIGLGAYVMDYDLSRTVRTIFEYSRQAVNIFGMLNRGCGLIRDPAFFRMSSVLKSGKRKAKPETVVKAAKFWFAEALRRGTDYVFYAMPSVDSSRESYRRVDEAVGDVVRELKSKGLYDRAALFLTGGYCRSENASHFDLNDFMKKRFRLFTHPGKPRDWLEAEAIAAISGSSMAHLYLRKGSSWEGQSFFEEIEQRGLVGALLEQEGVDILAGRSAEGGVVVASRRGRAHVVEDPDGRVTYLLKGGDPFGYEAIPQVMKAHEMLSLTRDTDYPDGIVQMLQLFRSQRSGDLVISADRSCDISGTEGVSSTHGSLHRDHIMVPFLSSVPFAGTTIRTADVFLQTLNFLGIEPDHKLDGLNMTSAASRESEKVGVL